MAGRKRRRPREDVDGLPLTPVEVDNDHAQHGISDEEHDANDDNLVGAHMPSANQSYLVHEGALLKNRLRDVMLLIRWLCVRGGCQSIWDSTCEP